MKKLINPIGLFLLIMAFSACNDKVEESWEVNSPVYMSYDELRTSFKVAPGQEIVQSGKIYFKDDYIFINEYQKGIHVVDNEDPGNPVVLKFIEIPGNVDLAIANNILYADSYVDLLSIDISDIDNITVVDRDSNAFPYIIPEWETGQLEAVDESMGVIIGYEVRTHTEEVEMNNRDFQRFETWESGLMMENMAMTDANPGGGAKSFGTGGSMARFTLHGNYLYTIDNFSLNLFNISDLKNPVFEKGSYIGWNIETVFPYKNKLFIGSQSGMYIYNIENAGNPEYISEFRHANACDPVVVEGNYAYVTLRGGNLCGAIESQLDVIDISDLANPELLVTYPMEEPYGLGIDNNVLFVCDGDAGLKIYDASDPLNISSKKLAHYPNINAFDVIPLGKTLLMIGIDGFFQYDYSDLEDIKQISHIPIYSKNE